MTSTERATRNVRLFACSAGVALMAVIALILIRSPIEPNPPPIAAELRGVDGRDGDSSTAATARDSTPNEDSQDDRVTLDVEPGSDAGDLSEQDESESPPQLWPVGTDERHAQNHSLTILKKLEAEDWRMKRYGCLSLRPLVQRVEQAIGRTLSEAESRDLARSIEQHETAIAELSYDRQVLQMKASLRSIARGDYRRIPYPADRSKGMVVDDKPYKDEAARLGGYTSLYLSGATTAGIAYIYTPQNAPELLAVRGRLQQLKRERGDIIRDFQKQMLKR